MKILSIIVIIVIICFGVLFFRSRQIVRNYDHLEQNARKVVSASELQVWATNLVTLNPTGTNLVPSNWGTNFPKQLLALCPRLGPAVVVYESDGTNSPPWVRVVWGSGMLGASGFEVGPTNFVSLQPGHAWQPGVYFFKR